MGMTDPLFTWIVYRDRAPLQSPLELGAVQAPTLAAAKNEAAARWPGVAVLIQSAASHRVRPLTALPLPGEVKQPRNQPGPRRKPMDRAKQQYFDFTAAKRAAHAAAKRNPRPTTPTERGQ